MSHGHSWRDIQRYSLAELGIFFKTVIQLERGEKAEKLSYLWMGSNLKHEGLVKIIKDINPEPKREVNQREVDNSWRRLAALKRKV